MRGLLVAFLRGLIARLEVVDGGCILLVVHAAALDPGKVRTLPKPGASLPTLL